VLEALTKQLHRRPLALVTVQLLAICGCMHTMIGDRGVAAPDWQHRLFTSSHGASGHAYVDKTKKRVYVWITQARKETAVFEQKYNFVAADLGWDTHWSSTNDVEVVLFDFGHKVTMSNAKKTGAPSNHIATLRFHGDSATGRFLEVK
jgi:hypothetical protein